MNPLLMILQAAPKIATAIQTVEALVPVPGQGVAKLEAVVGLVETEIAELASIEPQLEKAVGIIVKLLKSTSLLPTTAAAPVAAAAAA